LRKETAVDSIVFLPLWKLNVKRNEAKRRKEGKKRKRNCSRIP